MIGEKLPDKQKRSENSLATRRDYHNDVIYVTIKFFFIFSSVYSPMSKYILIKFLILILRSGKNVGYVRSFTLHFISYHKVDLSVASSSFGVPLLPPFWFWFWFFFLYQPPFQLVLGKKTFKSLKLTELPAQLLRSFLITDFVNFSFIRMIFSN